MKAVIQVYSAPILNLPNLLLGPKLIKHFLDLQLPVILQRMKGLCWHLKKA